MAGSSTDAKMKALGAVAAIASCAYLLWRCSTTRDAAGTDGTASPTTSVAHVEPKTAEAAAGWSAPLAASHVGDDVVVAALDLAAKAVRVQRFGPKDDVVAEGIALDDVAWSTDAELKVVACSEGVGVTWRGLRSGNLVRQLVVLGPDLKRRGEVTDVGAASCATGDALWFSDGARVLARPWKGAEARLDLPKGTDAALLCGRHKAFALLEEEETTSLLPLGADAGVSVTVMRERDFGEDEQRELATYTVGDDVGFVRLGMSGALAFREVTPSGLGPLRKLKSALPKDDDVVAVDASPRVAVIVYTEDVSEKHAPTPDSDPALPSDALAVCTKVVALRVDRQTFEESTVELSPGRCGYEVGPFFTGVVGEGVEVSWAERAAAVAAARAPVVGVAHALVAPAGTPQLSRIEQPSDALADAGCDANGCRLAALIRREGADAMAPGAVKILRYR
jgi:hypothetical protein